MSEIIVSEKDDILHIELNRREKHNALTQEMIRQLTDIFESAEARRDIRALYLWGHGGSFCSGADLQWMKNMASYNLQENLEDAQALFKMFHTAQKCTLPIVARVQGNVFGGGLGLLAVCDAVAADMAAQFSFSEVRLGIVPAVISSFVLEKMVTHKARELMITGRVFGAQEAQAAGLVEFVGREFEIFDYIEKTFNCILSAGPQAVRDMKKHLLQLRGSDLAQTQDLSVKLIAEKRLSLEGQEGMSSFLEKRKPSWHKTIVKKGEG